MEKIDFQRRVWENSLYDPVYPMSALGALVDPFFFTLPAGAVLCDTAAAGAGRCGSQRQATVLRCCDESLTYCYAVLGWKLIIADENIPFEYGFDGDPTWGPNSTGVTFYDWIMVHWEGGLRDGPQHSALWKSGSTPVKYVALSTTYYIIIVLIMGAVVSGIIIAHSVRTEGPNQR